MKLYETIAEALCDPDLGEPTDIALGSSTAVAEPAKIEEWRMRLLERLEREANVHKRMLLGIVLACLGLFAVGLFFLFYHRNDPSMYQLIFGGGSLASMLAVLNKARSILIDKAGYDILLSVIPTMSPEQVVTALKDLQYTQMSKK